VGAAIPHHYDLIDPLFSNNISSALELENDRYPVHRNFPWDSTSFIIASIEQVTVDDKLNSLKWTDYKTYPRYHRYNIESEQDLPPTRIPPVSIPQVNHA
jgi:hypothetical protein